ncbi:hypothetical protein FRB90_001797 [Tulasnella sp. 427]|nr:hypothetical protein FRB90_001797 [Tulasnella sp. 427]
MGKQRDYQWMADYASTCFQGKALRWFSKLDDETQGDWKLLERAMLRDFPTDDERPASATIPTAPAAAPPPPAAVASPPPPAEPADEGVFAIAEYDYDRQEDNEISFKDGDKIINVDTSIDDDWWAGTHLLTGMRGLFPGQLSSRIDPKPLLRRLICLQRIT